MAQADFSQKSVVTLVYALQAMSLVLGVTFLIAVVIDYVKRDDLRGTFLESHVTWQIRTFWYTVMWGVIGALTAHFLVGIPVLVANFIWFIYRFVKGWLRLAEGRPMYG